MKHKIFLITEKSGEDDYSLGTNYFSNFYLELCQLSNSESASLKTSKANFFDQRLTDVG